MMIKLIIGTMIIVWLSTGGAIEGKYLGRGDGFYKVEQNDILSSDLMTRYYAPHKEVIYIPEKNIIKIKEVTEKQDLFTHKEGR